MTVLYSLFGSNLRVKILRALLLSDTALEIDDLASLFKVEKKVLKKELSQLVELSLVKEKNINKNIAGKTANKIQKKETQAYTLINNFPHRESLLTILLEDESLKPPFITKLLKPVGDWELCLFTGIFTGDFQSEVDLLLVGNKINKNKLENVISNTEAQLGARIRYTILDPLEFEYRFQMFDKFVRDIWVSKQVRTIDRKYKTQK